MPIKLHYDNRLKTVIDMRGEPLTYQILNEAVTLAQSQWGSPDTFVGAPSLIEGLSSADLADLRRILQGKEYKNDNVAVGQKITTFISQTVT